MKATDIEVGALYRVATSGRSTFHALRCIQLDAIDKGIRTGRKYYRCHYTDTGNSCTIVRSPAKLRAQVSLGALTDAERKHVNFNILP